MKIFLSVTTFPRQLTPWVHETRLDQHRNIDGVKSHAPTGSGACNPLVIGLGRTVLFTDPDLQLKSFQLVQCLHVERY